MSFIHSIIFFTGLTVWIIILGMIIGIACLAVSQWWRRRGSASVNNILFGLFGPVMYRYFDYYKEWDRITHIPSLRKDCLRRHNNFKRFAYKRLVREARRHAKK